jgi:5-methylcytosine-specific restriction endonuclease McrA
MRTRTPEQRAKYLAAKARYRETHKAQIKAATKRYILANKETLRAKKKAEYRANPEPAKVRARRRESVLKEIRSLAPKAPLMDRQISPAVIRDPGELTQKLRARKSEYSRAHPEQARARQRKLWKERPWVIREIQNRRRAKKLNAARGNPQTIKNWDKAWRKKNAVKCYWCTGTFSPKQCQTDHIEPLSTGGAHAIENLCIACTQCNRTKGALPVAKWNMKLLQPALI